MSQTATARVASWPGYALPHGTTVNGYTIERVLANGGFGVTYLARDDLGQAFAIKEYFPKDFAIRQDGTVLAASAGTAALFAEGLDRFHGEAQALVRLSGAEGIGDHVVRAETCFPAHGTCFLVMAFVDGPTLASVLRQVPGGLAADRVWSLLIQVLTCVGAIHKAGLRHGDIKPANIVLRDDGTVVLIDFGLCREAGSDLSWSRKRSYASDYAPLEQVARLGQGPSSDIYAIGAVCYDAIGGRIVDAITRYLLVSASEPDPLPAAAQIGAGRYPDSLLRAIDAALALDPRQRPADVEALFGLLGTGDAVQEAAEPPQPARRRAWAMAALACAAGLALVIHIAPWKVVAGWQARRQETSRQQAARLEAAREEAARTEAIRHEAARQEAARQQEISAAALARAEAAQASGRFEEAAQAFRTAAEQGNAEAQLVLGRRYEKGDGVARDHAEAMRWYRKAAEQGQADAQYNVGYGYQLGWGVAQDYDEAARWFRKAADRGQAEAEYALGYLYQNGFGVPRSIPDAMKWYRLAADQNVLLAQYAIRTLTETK